ncbi:MAG: sensor histidine kinase KdpD [Bacteriovorax sp.]|nr:sensor histidine kinase KdpD [Bacteriovorax sp.]
MDEIIRPDPDKLLARLKQEEANKSRGAFRIFFGMCPGVGKTFAMLRAAQEQQKLGKNIVVGLIETHGRSDTEKMLEGLTVIPRKEILYREKIIHEFDVDKILILKPDIVLVDELAHTNAPSSRHVKRYQDVMELLDAGISVYTTLNVQHIESRADIVQQITGVQVRETVPDSLWDLADQIELIDISPQELIKRLKEGRVYLGDKAARAEDNFFKEAYLVALREISLRFTAEKVDHDLQGHLSIRQITSPWNTNERLMVAVSHSPHSAKLIRAARRMAFNLEAPWIAIHIDSGMRLNQFDQTTLFQNLNLARELGAEIVSLYDSDIVSALNRVALEKNVTQIILGRPERRMFRVLLDRLIQNTHFVDIHIIRQEKDSAEVKKKRKAAASPMFFTNGPVPYFHTLYFLIMVTILGLFLNPSIGYRAIGFLYLMSVIVVGFRSTLGPILFASLSGALIWDYVFIPPLFTFQINEIEDKMMCLAFVLVGVLSGVLARKTKTKERLLILREQKTSALFNLLKDFSTAMDIKGICDLTERSIQYLLDAQITILLANENKIITRKSTRSSDVSDKEFALALWSFDNKKTAGWSTQTLSESRCLSIPLIVPGKILGVLLFYPDLKKILSIEERNLLNSICFQLANALEHLMLQDQNKNIQLLEESEKLHQTLLNSVSHEMRIPLTSIMGTVSALQDTKIQNNPEMIKILNSELMQSSERLNRVIENLLNINRLNSGLLTLKSEWVEVSDLVHSTISNIKIKDHKIVVSELSPKVYLYCDERLLEHALVNLLLNAKTYSPEGTTITVQIEKDEKTIFIRVLDQGAGIPEDQLEAILDKFYRLPGSPTGGVGLGLSIVKGIMEAHGGSVHASNRTDETGAVFSLELPWIEPPHELNEA